jgi:PhnB protein
MTQIVPYLLYKDCEAALDWLARAFGFEEVLRYTGEEGYVNHAEMQFDGVPIYMGNPGEGYRNPKELGQETVGLYVEMEGDVDAHFERATAAGAEILEPPVDQEYGHRRYTARDPEGHHWFFAQIVKQVPAEGWGATTSTDVRA